MNSFFGTFGKLFKGSGDAASPELRSELQRIRNIADAGDWSPARMWAQKVSYGMVGPNHTEADKGEFKRFMTDFAARDPLVREILPSIVQAASEIPGIKQSDLTKKLKGSDEALEALRYVLYFASELGQIVRIKKGNTYLLYLPGAAPT